MRRLLQAFAVLVLVAGGIGLALDPASAQIITPGQPIFVVHGTCAGWVSGVTYGSVAVAQFDEQSGSNCHVESSITVNSYRGGGLFSEFTCSWWGFLSNPYPGLCHYNWRQVQAITPGAFVGVDLRLCYGAGPTTFSCLERSYSIWG